MDARSAADRRALPRRHARSLLLPQGLPRTLATRRTAPRREGGEHGQGRPLHHRRLARHARRHGEPGLHRDPRHDVSCENDPRGRLARVRHGPARVVRQRRPCGPRASQTARGSQAELLPEDVGEQRPAPLRAAARRRDTAGSDRSRDGARRGARAAGAQARDGGILQSKTWGTRVRRRHAQCVRPDAAISTPLAWDEVSPRLDPATFNLRNFEKRLAGSDPWADFWRRKQALPKKLAG